MSFRPEVFIFESEYKAIIAESQKHLQREVGGDLYGTLIRSGQFGSANRPVIWLASGPGREWSGGQVHFQQDTNFMNKWQNELMGRFGIQFLGSWHSHHTLKLNTPSSGDVYTVQTYARRRNRDIALDVIVNHHHLNGLNFKTVMNPYLYINAQNGSYQYAQFNPLPGESPLRKLIRNDFNTFPATQFDWRDVPQKFRPENSAQYVQHSTGGTSYKALQRELKKITAFFGNENVRFNQHEWRLEIQYNYQSWFVKISTNIPHRVTSISVVLDNQDIRLDEYLEAIGYNNIKSLSSAVTEIINICQKVIIAR